MAGEDISLRKMLNFLAFVGIVCVAVSLFLGRIWPSVNIFGNIASTISLIIMSIAGYFFAVSKRNTAYIVTYWVAMVLILVFTFWGWFW